MKLKYLSLNKIVDAAYGCGLKRYPISLIIAAPPGTGKTWSTKGISDQVDVPFVQYITGSMSPTAHRAILMRNAENVRLIIHDDLGLCERWTQDAIFSTYMMAHGGLIQEQHFKTHDSKKIDTSIILCCTLAYWADHQKTMLDKGMLDRFLPVVIDLSEETRIEYQKSITISTRRDPPKRLPITEMRDPQPDIINDYNISPRWLLSLQCISMFLSEEELKEFISVITNPMRYEI